MNHSSDSECRSYPSPLIHPLGVPPPPSATRALSPGTSQGRAEETLLLPSHVQLGQHSLFNSSTCIPALNRVGAVAGWMGRDQARDLLSPQSL